MWYNLAIFIIIIAAAIDQYYLVAVVTYETELNPVGKYLIYLGGTPLFSAAKLAGCSIAIGLLTLYREHFLAKYAVAALVAFQMWLLWFMLG